jgi:hypothetical protein
MPGNRGMSPRWRVGRSLGRTLYLDDKVIGMVDTPELAARIVAAMNRATGAPDKTQCDWCRASGVAVDKDGRCKVCVPDRGDR